MESGKQETTRAPFLNSGQLLAELQAQIREEKLSSDAILHQIVEAARVLTRADGAALAIRQNGSVVCLARAGTMAPALGSQLQVDSGISGQCMRTGAPLFCEDTGTDTRVDREVCLGLGLRSLALAPVGKWPAVTGVLEIFSAAPSAFKRAEVQLLAQLAELVEDPGRPFTPSSVSDDGAGVGRLHPRTTLSVLRAGLQLAGAAGKRANGKFILASVILVFVVFWLGLKVRAAWPNASAAAAPRATRGSSPVAGQPSSTPPATPLPPSPAAAGNTSDKAPDPVPVAGTSEETRSDEPAASPEREPEVISVANAPAAPKKLTSPTPQAVEEAAIAPSMNVVYPDSSADLNGVLSPVGASPVLATAKSSTGISGGIVERQVKPIYPREALRLKRAGDVVLQAVIKKDGNVGDLKVVRGDSMLARAAMDAVTKWRYQPYQLNGQPIQRTTEITIVFRLP